jgi:hypothetical protein
VVVPRAAVEAAASAVVPAAVEAAASAAVPAAVVEAAASAAVPVVEAPLVEAPRVDVVARQGGVVPRSVGPVAGVGTSKSSSQLSSPPTRRRPLRFPTAR